MQALAPEGFGAHPYHRLLADDGRGITNPTSPDEIESALVELSTLEELSEAAPSTLLAAESDMILL